MFRRPPTHSVRAPRFPRGSLRVAWLGVAMAVATCLPVAAQTDIAWALAGNGNWGTAGNWSPANVPNVASERAVFSAATGRTITLDTNYTAGGIRFVSGAGSYTITRTASGTRALTLGSYGILHEDDSLQTISGSTMRLTINTATAFNVASTGNLTISATGGVTGLSATNILTLSGSSTGVGTISSAISGTGGKVLKSGTGTWILSGNNSYSGGTTLAGGNLQVGSANALGTTGALSFTGGTLLYAAGITTDYSTRIANSSSAISINTNGNNVAYAGALASTNSGGLTKFGNGTLTLSGSSTFGGITTINAGTLAVSNSNALGAATSWGNTIASGATLQLSNNISLAEHFFVAGTGVSSAGAINNLSGNNTISEQISLSGAATLNATAGSLTIGGQIHLNGSDLTLTGAGDFNLNSQINGDSSSSLIKTGSGTVTLSGTNNFTGGTTLGAGTLVLNSAGALPTYAGDVTFTGGTLRYGSGISTDYSSRIANSTGTIAIDTNGNNVTYASSLASTNTGGLTKSGTGTLTLSTANSYTGATTVNTGTLNLQNATAAGTGTITVNSGGVLQLEKAAGNMVVANTVVLAGGMLENVDGDQNQFSAANITLTADSTVRSSAVGERLILGGSGATTTISIGSNTLTVDGPGNTIIYGAVGASGDTGNFVSNSTGTVWFNRQYGSNNYTGTTTVNSGTLVLGTDNNSLYNNQTIRGDLIIGNGVSSATVLFPSGYGNNKIADTSTITINRGSTLNMNGAYDTVGALNLTGGNVALGGTAGVTGGSLILTGDINVNASDTVSTVSGFQFWLTPGSGNRNITVADSALDTEFLVTASVVSGGITKLGDGRMTLAAGNTYTEATNINDGVINIRHNTALGNAIGVSGGTVVASGAALEIQQDAAYNGGSPITVASEYLTLNGSGVANDGALRNISGNNTWGGAVNVASNARINSDADRLTINGSVIGSPYQLTVGGVGDTWINGAIGHGAGTIVKDGTGTLTVTGNNTYQGTTTVTSGVLNVRHNDGLGSVLSGTTVASGAALELQRDAAYNSGNNIAVGNETLSLSGTGISNGGALRNVAGDNSYAGAITIASASTRINSDAGSLTLSNTVAVGSNALTVGGAANTTITGQLTGTSTSSLTKDGAGTLTLSNSTNTFAGDVAITSGTLATGANSSLNSASIDVNISAGAELDLVAYAQSIGTLSGLGNVEFGGNGQLTLLANTTFGGTFTGTGTIVVSSGVSLTLAADFNAAGVTIVLAGGTLNVNGSDSVFAGLTLTGNSTIDFDSVDDSTIQFTNLSLGSYSLAVSGWSDEQDYFLVTNDPGNYGAAPLNQVTFAPSGSWTGNDTIWTGDYTGYTYDTEVRPWKPVPEPSTYGAMFMAAALAGLSYRRWRANRAEVKK